ncbi:MAG: hypothetical protein WCG75_03120 [Armatimonadota bacterium]
MKAFLTYLGVALGFVTAFCIFCQHVYDSDNFYHLGHAALYYQNGPFYRAFPWTTYSVLSQHNSDLWWGFHLLLAPLTVLQNKVVILAVAPGYLMLLNLLFSRLAVVRMGWSQWYGFALLPASLGFLMRMDTVRPQALSSSLLILLFAAIFTEAPWLAIGTAALIGFLHPTLSYLIVMVGFFTFIQRRVTKKEWNPWLEVSCLVVALSISCIRPGMMDGLHLLKIQLYDLMLVRRAGEVKNFGVELERLNVGYFLRAFLGPLILFVVSGLIWLKFRDRTLKSSAFLGAFGIMAAAFMLSILITRRGSDQFAPFAILTSLVIFHQCKGIPKFTAHAVGVNVFVVIVLFIQTHLNRADKYNATDYRAGANWLIAHTQPGEIVGQGVWSDFGPLFYWDTHNRFFGGMDPVFQYRYNPSTYWLMTLICAGREQGKTGAFNPAKSSAKEEDISTAWPRDLKTKWLFCSKDWDIEYQDALKKDKHTKIAYSDKHCVIYEFLP